jgi:hypothetical protein
MNFIAYLTGRSMSLTDTPGGLISLANLNLIELASTLLSVILAIRIVQTIDTYHETRIRQVQPAFTMLDRPSWSLRIYAGSIGLGIVALGIVLSSSGNIAQMLDRLANAFPTDTPLRAATRPRQQ